MVRLLQAAGALSVLSAAGCGLPIQSQPTTTPAPRGARHSVAVQRSDYLLVFTNVEVNGHSTLALLDSGGSTGIQLAASLANQLGLALQDTTDQRSRLDTTARQRQTGTLATFALGDYRVGPVTFDALEGDVERIAQQVGTSFEAILGWQFLAQFYSVLDYARGRLDFEDTSSSASPTAPPAAALALDITPAGGVPLVAARVDSTEVRFVLDTGAPISTLDKSLVDSLGSARGSTSVLLQGQRIPLDLREVVFGDQRLQIGFLAKELGALKPLGASGALGTTLLGQYRLVLDGPARRAYLV